MKTITADRITLTRLKAMNHLAWLTLQRWTSTRPAYAIVFDGSNFVASLGDVSLFWNGRSWTVVPQPWMTLKTYATREGIGAAEAYRRWRKGAIPGAYVVRGLVVVPVQVETTV